MNTKPFSHFLHAHLMHDLLPKIKKIIVCYTGQTYYAEINI